MSQKYGIVLFVMFGLIVAGCGGGAEEAASSQPQKRIVRGKAYVDAPKDSESEFQSTAIFINDVYWDQHRDELFKA